MRDSSYLDQLVARRGSDVWMGVDLILEIKDSELTRDAQYYRTQSQHLLYLNTIVVPDVLIAIIRLILVVANHD